MVSRMCAGRKDCLTVRGTDGDKTKVQKRLLLGSLRDIYTLFKEDVDNPRIGFSSFAALRPRYCVSAGMYQWYSRGMHMYAPSKPQTDALCARYWKSECE